MPGELRQALLHDQKAPRTFPDLTPLIPKCNSYSARLCSFKSAETPKFQPKLSAHLLDILAHPDDGPPLLTATLY